MKNILLIRFSAMGDVILAAQVAKAALLKHPDIHLWVLTRPAFRPFFPQSERLSFVDVDLKGRHRGIGGLFQLFREISKKVQPDVVLDLHHVLRSRILAVFFSLMAVPVFRLKKNRKARKALTRKKNKELKALKPLTEAMREVWKQAGYHFALEDISRDNGKIVPKRIGIAPFASTDTKTYPLRQMKEVIVLLEEEGYEIFLFGGGEKDKQRAEELMEGQQKVHSAIGNYSLEEQMELMQSVELMLSMDSSNMHLARLLGIPLVSIWGATHPLAGYGPVNQDDPDMMIQVPTEQLTCRPCSIFGQKACYRDRMYCLENISPLRVMEGIRYALKKHQKL